MSSIRRYTSEKPCPICGGHPDLPLGQERRYVGYRSHDDNFPRCTCEERAGGLPLDTRDEPPTYVGSEEKSQAWMMPALAAEPDAATSVFQSDMSTPRLTERAAGDPVVRKATDAPERVFNSKNLPESAAVEVLASDLGQRFKFHFGTDRWYGYEAASGTWAPTSKTVVHAAVARSVDAAGIALNGYGERYITSILGLLRGRLGIEAWSRELGFSNGVLVGGVLRPHGPENLLLTALPYPYDPTATCEPVIDWLTETMGGNLELVHVLRCGLNAILNGRADIQVFLELLGPGGAGKGTFMRLCYSLVGKHASVATELKRLEEIRFEPARLRDKLLIQINDSDKYGGDVSMLKRITGGDDIPYEEKGKQSPGDFRAAGFVVVTCNEPIRSSDYTSGLARRRITIRFGRQIDMSHARDLEAEFAPYLPGVYNWANELEPAQVAQDLRGASTRVAAIAALREEVEHSTNPIAAWALEKLYYLPGGRAKVGLAKRVSAYAGQGGLGIRAEGDDHVAIFVGSDRLLYASYCEWCEGAGVQALPHTRFTSNLVDLLANQYKLPGVSAKITNQGSHVFGVTLSGETVDGVVPVLVRDVREHRLRAVREVRTDQVLPTAEDPRVMRGREGREDREVRQPMPQDAPTPTGSNELEGQGKDGGLAPDLSRTPQSATRTRLDRRESSHSLSSPSSLSTGKVVEFRVAEVGRGADDRSLPPAAGEFEEGDA